jgi:hypothetical protein
MGNREAMISAWTVHDLLKPLAIGLLLRVFGLLGSLPKRPVPFAIDVSSARVVIGVDLIVSVASLVPHNKDLAGVLSGFRSAIDQVGWEANKPQYRLVRFNSTFCSFGFDCVIVL